MALQRIMLEGEESRGLMNWKQGWHKQHRTITTMLEFHDVSRNMAAPFRMVQNHEKLVNQKSLETGKASSGSPIANEGDF